MRHSSEMKVDGPKTEKRTVGKLRVPDTSYHRQFIFVWHFIPKGENVTSYQSLHPCALNPKRYFIPRHFIPVHFIPSALHQATSYHLVLHTKSFHTKCTSFKITSYYVHFIPKKYTVFWLRIYGPIMEIYGDIRYQPWLIIDIRKIYRPWSDS